MKKSVVFALLCLVLGAVAASATTIVYQPLRRSVQMSDLVLVGYVVGVGAEYNRDGEIVTKVDVLVEERLKGLVQSGEIFSFHAWGGRLDGVDNGTVFSIWRNGSHTANRMAHPESSRISESPKSGAGRVSLPDEYASHAMVFRTFDKVSYALVMEGVEATRVGYELKHPDATY